MGDEAASPQLITRREFLQRSSMAGAALLAGLAIAPACTSGSLDERIVSAAIHPAVGIGRVGNSRETFYFGPEVPGALPRAPGGFKDAHGAVARQAARFRVYGLDADGHVVRELTAADADITWRVGVANAKAAWYDFGIAFDIPDAQPVRIRNYDVAGAARAQLVVSSEGSIKGIAGGPVALDGGAFFDQPVTLGELMTDEAGRLVVLPGQGKGYAHGHNALTSFAGNDGWTDDVCDGPVRATVRLGDRHMEAAPAWLLTTPPNYGPGIAAGLVTLYDAAHSMFVDAGDIEAGEVSFTEDILPLFARMADMRWVNEGYFEGDALAGGDVDWLASKVVDQLADPSASVRTFREGVFREFRDPAFEEAQPKAAPAIYGDGVSLPATGPRQWLAVTPLQYANLKAWSEGRFNDDREKAVPASFAVVPEARRPETLDRAALASCLGGAFHPGIEAPWVMRERSVWERPFRLRVASTSPDERDYGTELTRSAVFAAGGPLQGCSPGGLTRWLGVPWHSDAASCRSGYERKFSTVLPTFWPARIPNQVLAEEDYRKVMDRSKPMSERLASFQTRRDWERFVARPEREDTLALMIREWWRLGLVTERPGPGDAPFPRTFKVESDVGFDKEPEKEYGADLWVPQG